MTSKSPTRLPQGSPWKRRGGWLVRTERFADFRAAMRWVGRVAREAERWNHHPRIDIRWNTVTLRLRTEEQASLTSKDWQWVDATADRLRRGRAAADRPPSSPAVTRG